jgi:hypothetical protein
MIDPDLDLSIPSLMRACKGNVAMLPSFMVHDDHVWPRSGVVRTDSRGRIHMRRSTFLRTVAGKLPIREGIWHRMDCQEFHLDLKPHHLQGSEDQAGGNRREAARGMVKADRFGRVQGDEGYGDDLSGDHRLQDVARDVAEAKARGTSGSVGSTVLAGNGDAGKVGLDP